MRALTCHIIPLTLALSLLAGCGFQLRGEINISASVARAQVQGADRELVDALTTALRARDSAVDSVVTIFRIDINASSFAREVLRTDSKGRAREYAIHYRLVFAVTDADGAPLLTAESIALQRAYVYDPKLELQTEQEAEFLRADMRSEAVQRILQRLIYL